ncbi:hypothetical protein K439DRAFT_1418381 [Ramaria rubella]|nr:hypothetical protein K439DRAFT_1418381 [Ramaria rubella]
MPASNGYYCDCTKYCKRYKQVSGTTFDHKKYRNQIPDFLGTSGAASSSLQTPFLKRGHEEEDLGPHKHLAVDAMEEPVDQRGFSPGVDNTQGDFGNDRGHLFESNAGEDPGMPDSEGSGTDSISDPECEDTPSRTPSPHLSSDESDTLEGSLEPQGIGNKFHANVDLDFAPAVEKLSVAMDFIKAIQVTLLDNGDLSNNVLTQLRNPPQHLLQLEDRPDLHSLKMFLAMQKSSQQTYEDVRLVHNEFYPDELMLSLRHDPSADYPQSRVAEWSGVEVIVHDMCPEGCMAYTGPFKDLKVCPFVKCRKSHWDPILLESSVGATKVLAQTFIAIPIGVKDHIAFHRSCGKHRKYRNIGIGWAWLQLMGCALLDSHALVFRMS